MVQTMEVPLDRRDAVKLRLKEGLLVSLSPFDTPEKITFSYDGVRAALSVALTYLTPDEPRTSVQAGDVQMQVGRESGKLYFADIEHVTDVVVAIQHLIGALEDSLDRPPTPEPSVKDLNFSTVKDLLADEQLQQSVERAFRNAL